MWETNLDRQSPSTQSPPLNQCQFFEVVILKHYKLNNKFLECNTDDMSLQAMQDNATQLHLIPIPWNRINTTTNKSRKHTNPAFLNLVTPS